MSKTDKTRPWWVQLQDPKLGLPLRVRHSNWWHMRFGAMCQPHFPLPATRRPSLRWQLLHNVFDWHQCEVWSRYRDIEKIHGRSGWRRSYPNKHGSARMALRRLQADWRKTAAADRDTIDSTLDAPTNRWVWRRWYWD